ncbi:MAG TPA: outer membrane beta-barrel protein [Gemmatimonadales bacterium]|nr:outer membrane beta-barrel protein [Gemmatimonadales bacterium]
MRTMLLATTALIAGATVLSAQAPRAKPEIRPFVGASIPTGGQRDFFNDAPVFGLQGAVELKPTLHLVGTFAWTPGHNDFVFTRDNVNVFEYDVGLELSMVRPLGGNWQFRPYVGVGGGARTYAYQADQLGDKTCAAGYGALGTEFQLGRTALRVEGRDNVFCFRSPVPGEDSKTRNDVRLTAGVAYHFR